MIIIVLVVIALEVGRHALSSFELHVSSLIRNLDKTTVTKNFLMSPGNLTYLALNVS